MDKFKFLSTEIEGLYIIDTVVYSSNRGYLIETFNEREFEKIGKEIHFVQDNESKSVKGVLRGLHFQSKNSQGKLVRVVKGEIYDVAVDLRAGSDTFGNYKGIILSEYNKRQFYIPEGFAHGFLVLSDEAILNYKCTEFYDPQYESGIIWNDKDLNINWPIEKNQDLILSESDKKLYMLNEFKQQFICEEEIYIGNMSLKPIDREDIEYMRNWRNNENINKTFFNSEYISSEAQRKWYEKYRYNASDRMFIINYKNNPVGTVALYNIDYKNNTAEFGRLLIGDIKNRCKNIGLIATRTLCEYGFNKLGLNKIILEVFKDNISAINLYRKVGFKIVEEKSVYNGVIVLMQLCKDNKKSCE